MIACWNGDEHSCLPIQILLYCLMEDKSVVSLDKIFQRCLERYPRSLAKVIQHRRSGGQPADLLQSVEQLLEVRT
jgi:hypothetical protein